MSEQRNKHTLCLLKDAWASGDIDGVMDCFAENAIYSASIGREPGHTAIGLNAIRKLISHMFNIDPIVTSEISNLVIINETATWKWRYHFAGGGLAIGCDFFEFDDRKIVLKDAYRKVYEEFCNNPSEY